MSDSSPTSVYLYYDSATVLLYVGITSRDVRRQSEHNKVKEWWPFVASQTVEHFDSRIEAHRREVELIQTFRPPFNVQHNPGYEVVRTAFLAYREAVTEYDNPTDIVRAAKKRVPLVLTDESGDELIFRTTPLFASVAVRMVKPMNKVPLMFAGVHSGILRSVEIEGPGAVLRCANRRAIGVGRNPFARVSIINTRDGSGTLFHIKSVQACDEDEYQSLKEPA